MNQRQQQQAPLDRVGRPMHPASLDVSPAESQGVLQTLYKPVEADYALTVPGCTNFYSTPVIAGLAAGATSALQTIKFTDSGKIIAMVADVIDPRAISTPLSPEEARTILGISVISGVTKQQIMSNGDDAQPTSIAMLFGGQLQRVVPLIIPVESQDTWQVRFTNFSATLSGAKAQFSFMYIADRQFRRAA